MPLEHPDTILSEVVSASLGGAVSASILYPLEVLKTRMQSRKDEDEDGESSKGMIEYAKHLYQKEGYRVYLNGIETSAFQSSMEKAFYFFAYTALKQMHSTLKALMSRDVTAPMSAGTNLLLGCLAEWAHLPITMPIDCLSTAIQTSQKQNSVQLMLTILKGGNMYKGVEAYYILCFKPALQYTVFEQVKVAVLKSRKNKTLTAAESFLLGMVARTVATVAVFPFVRAKVIMQSQNTSNTTSPEVTIRTILKETYQSNGIAGLYQGIGPELTRGVFSAALMLMIKEQLNGGVKTLLYGPVKK
jgi:solute carrier family 25 (peroxisomal adenine nucleotide transporter), member 17